MRDNLGEHMWSNLLAFLSGVPGRVNRATQWRRAKVVCTLESVKSSGSGSWSQLDSNSLRHLTAQFVVDGSRGTRSKLPEDSVPSTIVNTTEDLQDLKDMQSQSVFEWSQMLEVLPTLVQKIQSRREELVGDIREMEKVLPAPLLQSIFFTWEEPAEEESSSFFGKVGEIHRIILEGVDTRYKKILSAMLTEGKRSPSDSITTNQSSDFEEASVFAMSRKIFPPFNV